ncbi:2OG-Fe dioxygenase family protein [Leptothoe spongobia]|uniref:2OG-Fe dioxygenase family protein n=1 Tax=Leptothoe spongobia TAU-MAC 1115 TaxID=1967444 RepID=A0A947GHM1_9CYAN|nr:2OG-Fe dioxygenase family protein [Leptothoe spongobia]MBT9314818.1 2OG-Fe dioxygenase family protein [Leptothoe spongobia TAU-MAC 1115]
MLSLSTRKQFSCLSSYAIETISERNLKTIQPFFETLPTDPYLEGNYRFRRFSHFQITDRQLTQLPHAFFYQSKTYNRLLGNVKRDYEELSIALVQSEPFKQAVLTFFEFCRQCSPFREVGVHQIRIATHLNQSGNPAPEGIHHDGVDLVGILCIARQGVSGAETQLSVVKGAEPILRKVLNPGELLVFNDHQFFHYTTPILPIGNSGYRDVFVFTCPDIPFDSPA